MNHEGKGGRPTKFTQETIDKLLIAIRKGATYELACNYAGISFVLFRQWVMKGEAEIDESFVKFLKDLKEAEGHTALVWLDKIDKAMNDGAWQAAAWKLERRYPKHYGRIEKESHPIEDNTIEKAKDDVLKLKAENNGFSSTVKD